MPQRPIIHFAPANSFPARSYDKLFRFLRDDFEIGYLNLHAHDARFPVTDGWQFLAAELKAEIEKRYFEPVIGVGHSLGGILHFLVAVEKPELYRAIVLLDAPLASRLSGAGLSLAKRTKLIRKIAPFTTAVRRRREWKSKAEAFEHFTRKFRSFDAEMVRDYVEHGTIQNARGNVELVFKPETEAGIYRTIPHNFWKFKGKLKVPAAYIGGTDSREARLARLDFMRRNFPFDFYFIEGSHHFPFQKPFETAQTIKQTFRALADIRSM
jgi:pimeloyl-ACP methyl ester carboxylesterase